MPQGESRFDHFGLLRVDGTAFVGMMAGQNALVRPTVIFQVLICSAMLGSKFIMNLVSKVWQGSIREIP